MGTVAAAPVTYAAAPTASVVHHAPATYTAAPTASVVHAAPAVVHTQAPATSVVMQAPTVMAAPPVNLVQSSSMIATDHEAPTHYFKHRSTDDANKGEDQ